MREKVKHDKKKKENKGMIKKKKKKERRSKMPTLVSWGAGISRMCVHGFEKFRG